MSENKHSKTEIGKRLAIIRGNMNMSQSKFAEHVELSTNFLSQVENGNRGLSAESIARISLKTGYSTDYILLGKKGDRVIAPDLRTRIKDSLIEAIELLDKS